MHPSRSRLSPIGKTEAKLGVYKGSCMSQGFNFWGNQGTWDWCVLKSHASVELGDSQGVYWRAHLGAQTQQLLAVQWFNTLTHIIICSSLLSSAVSVYAISWIISTERQVAAFSVMQPWSSIILNPTFQCKHWAAKKINKFNLFFFMRMDVLWDSEVAGSHHCPYRSLLLYTLWQVQGPNLCPHERWWIINSGACSMREYLGLILGFCWACFPGRAWSMA